MRTYWAVIIFLLASGVQATETTVDCDEAITTLAINHCAAQDLNEAEQKMQRYLSMSVQQHQYDAALVDAIHQSQLAWRNYVKADCHAVYTQWREGTIRTVMSLSCSISHTKRRTHDLWQNYLTFMDSSPPVLPEPEKT